jgi:type I restriction enzyme S subunit
MNEWLNIILARALTFQNGRLSPERGNCLPYPVYGSNGIIGFTKNTNADPGTIVIGRVGSYCGSLYFSKTACWVTDNAIKAHVIDNNSDRFFYYLLQTLDLNQRQAGSGQPLLNQAILNSIPIAIPTPSEQRRIAHILGTLDEKIENNRKTAKTLEAMAQAIFKSWFVDFDPVRAKMNGESRESICKRLKLTPEILDLFPDRLVDSELGEIPEGWLTTTLGSITSRIKRGLSPAYSDGYGILVLNQKCIREFTVDTSKARRHDPTVRSIEGLLLEVGDVLVNSTGVGTLGRVAQVLHIQESSIIDSHVTLVRPDKKCPWSYLGQLVMTLQPQIEEMGEGSTGQTELSRGKLANLLITLPTTSILEKFHKLILPVKGRISDCERQIQILKNIRDTLLPKLISGEIRVPDSEVIVEEAL